MQDSVYFRRPEIEQRRGHFHLLDRYIRRIDALLPEDMEDLVRPLSYKPNQEQTTRRWREHHAEKHGLATPNPCRTLKITFPDEFVKPEGLTEEEVRDFLYPLAAQYIALGWQGEGGREDSSHAACTPRFKIPVPIPPSSSFGEHFPSTSAEAERTL